MIKHLAVLDTDDWPIEYDYRDALPIEHFEGKKEAGHVVVLRPEHASGIMLDGTYEIKETFEDRHPGVMVYFMHYRGRS